MNSEFIKENVFSLGAEVCGIADIESFKDAPEGFHPKDIYAYAKSVIVYGKPLTKSLFQANTNVPYTMVKNKLVEIVDNISVQLTFKIEAEGFQAIPVPADEPYEYWDIDNRRGKGILSLKHSAAAAGIGTLGKNTLLINKQFGNRLLLGAVLTNAELKADEPAAKQCPENCNLCINSCPQQALDGITINQKKCREICASSTPGGGALIACNICRKVCPFSLL